MSVSRHIPPEEPETSSVFVIGIDDLGDPAVRLGAAHWLRLKGERRFPARDELVPRDMAAFLRNIALVRVLDDGRDYEYRIAGDAHVEAHGASFQGTYLSDLEVRAPRYGRLTRDLRACARDRGALLPARLGRARRAGFALRLLRE